MPPPGWLVAPAAAWPDQRGGRRPGRKQGQGGETGADAKLNDATSLKACSGAILKSEEILELGVANADIP
jgi:hypothetical protein